MSWELRLIAIGVLLWIVRLVFLWVMDTHPIHRVADELVNEDVSRMREHELDAHEDRATRTSCTASLLLIALPTLGLFVHAAVWIALVKLEPDGAWVKSLGTRHTLAGLVLGVLCIAGAMRVKPAENFPESEVKRARWMRRGVDLATVVALTIAPRGFLIYFATQNLLGQLPKRNHRPE